MVFVVAVIGIGALAGAVGVGNATPKFSPHPIQPSFLHTDVDITIYVAGNAPPPTVKVVKTGSGATAATARYLAVASKSSYRYQATITGSGTFDLRVSGKKSELSPNCCYSIGWGGNTAGPVTVNASTPRPIRMSSREQTLH